ncbi:MAG: SigE family RNA polymerase sigma factor [Dermatophilaceae bacterium]
MGWDRGDQAGHASWGGDDEGFSEFVVDAQVALTHAAFSLTANWQEAEDLVQSALLAVYTRWTDLLDRSSAGAYTRRTMLHLYISEHRRARWDREVTCAQPPDLIVLAPIEQCLDRSIIWPALRQMTDRQRAVVLFRFGDDLSVADTAALLGCAPATVRSQTTRALALARRAAQPLPEVAATP